MLPVPHLRHGRRLIARAGVALLVLGAGLAMRGAPVVAQDQIVNHHHSHGHSMTDEEMRRWVNDWFATHPVVGLSPQATAADTFIASGTTFDNGKAGTVDTAYIFTGQSILWRATLGVHTTTNGTGSGDPNAGTLWDAPIDAFSGPEEFTHTFTSPGTYPFFCRPHELSNMRGYVVVTDPVPADTFTTFGFAFDADGNLGTQMDTVQIEVGEWILWRHQGGDAHTATNGAASSDPEAGTLFDVPLDPSHLTFFYQFNQAGTFPFFCRPHEFDDMKGVVIVGTPVSATPPPGRTIGFASEPAPNPTTGVVSFRVAMPTSGRASVEVLDASGRLVAVPFNEDRGPGVFDVRWSGITRTGRRAVPGVYYVKLSMPVFSESRRIVLTH